MADMVRESWGRRHIDAIDADERSERQISLAAGLGPNFVGQMKKAGKMPSASAVLRLCRALWVSVTYIFTGAKMTPEDEEFLTRFSALHPDQKKALLSLLHS